MSVHERVTLVPIQIQYIFAQLVRADASFGIYFFSIGRNETRQKGENRIKWIIFIVFIAFQTEISIGQICWKISISILFSLSSLCRLDRLLFNSLHTSCYCCEPGLQLWDPAPLYGLSLWTRYFIWWAHLARDRHLLALLIESCSGLENLWTRLQLQDTCLLERFYLTREIGSSENTTHLKCITIVEYQCYLNEEIGVIKWLRPLNSAQYTFKCRALNKKI